MYALFDSRRFTNKLIFYLNAFCIRFLTGNVKERRFVCRPVGKEMNTFPLSHGEPP